MQNKGKKFDIEVLSIDDIDRLLAACSNDWVGVRNRALLSVYIYGALRCNAALDLRPQDVRLGEQSSIRLINGKGGKNATVGLNRKAIIPLEKWFQIRPDSLYLFCTRVGKRLSDSYVRQMIKRMAQKAGIQQRVHPHGLRHTSLYHLSNAVRDIKIVQRQATHSTLATTHSYLDHLNPSVVIEAVSQADW